jgi:hypothetical protein
MADRAKSHMGDQPPAGDPSQMQAAAPPQGGAPVAPPQGM